MVQIIDEAGVLQAEYVYSPWGEIISAEGDLAEINPLRYRGYYYDSETGFYYLQSRYYDPQNRRFINADIYVSTGSSDAVSCNMFAYCNNNPIANIDESGESLLAIFVGVAFCAVVGGIEAYCSVKSSGASAKEAWIQGGIGLVSAAATSAVAAIPGIGVPLATVVSAGIGCTSSVASEAVHYAFNKDDPDYEFDVFESCANVITGTVGNALSGALSAGVGVAVIGEATQAFVGGVASTAFTSVYFATKKLLAELY